MIYVGIDPGMKPAICIDNNNAINLYLCKNLVDFSNYIKTNLVNKDCFVLAEEVWSTPVDGHVGSFNFGYSVGYIDAVLYSYDFSNYEKIKPYIWKKYYSITLNKQQRINKVDSKQLSINKALELKNDLNLLPTSRCKKLNHNLAEAYLICQYAKIIKGVL